LVTMPPKALRDNIEQVFAADPSQGVWGVFSSRKRPFDVPDNVARPNGNRDAAALAGFHSRDQKAVAARRRRSGPLRSSTPAHSSWNSAGEALVRFFRSTARRRWSAGH